MNVYRERVTKWCIQLHDYGCLLQARSSLPYKPSTLNLKALVHTQPVGERPLIELEETDHPISVEQHRGITMARVQQIAESGIRPGALNLRLRVQTGALVTGKGGETIA